MVSSNSASSAANSGDSRIERKITVDGQSVIAVVVDRPDQQRLVVLIVKGKQKDNHENAEADDRPGNETQGNPQPTPGSHSALAKSRGRSKNTTGGTATGLDLVPVGNRRARDPIGRSTTLTLSRFAFHFLTDLRLRHRPRNCTAQPHAKIENPAIA